MTKPNKILEKLRKLMNLKESASQLGNEGEANAAAAGIARLLLEYNLSESDIPDQEKIDNPITAEEIPYKAEYYNGSWYANLIATVGEYNMCSTLVISSGCSRMKRSKFQIVGRKKNVEIVLYLISFLANQFVIHGKKKYPYYKKEMLFKYGQTPLSQISYMKSFLAGCIVGLDEKFSESKQDIEKTHDITALIKSSKSDIEDFLKDQKIGTCRPSKESLDARVALSGVAVGKEIEIKQGIHSRVNEERMLI